VLIMRRWPRGVRKSQVDVWLKDASPSIELLEAYHHQGLPWSTFERRYRTEMLEERPQVLDDIRGLEREHGEVRLLCYERIPPEEHCHRLTLIDMLRQARTDAPASP
jgi:uncharacterized protein YeaO (DUF488 family)